MEAIANIFGNSTMLLIVKIVFVEQDYRTINLFSEEDHSDLSNQIIEIACNSLKPINNIILGKENIRRSRSEAPILNVIVLNSIDIEKNKSFLRSYIFPEDVTLILPNGRNNENEDLSFKKWRTLSTKAMILTESFLMFFNVFQTGPISTITLSSVNPFSTQKLIQTYFSTDAPRQKINLTIFFQFSPPKSCVAPVGVDFVLIGPDGTLAELLAKWLNATPMFCSDIGITYPSYANWLDDKVIAPRVHYQFYYTKLMTNNVVTIFNKSITDNMDLHLSPFSINEELAEENMKLKTESLYPHEKDCLVIMVPKQAILEHFLQKITKNSDIQSICIALLLFTIVRIIIQKSSCKQWIIIFIKSLGIFLNQGKMHNETSVEVAWDINLRGFSVLATIALSVIIYKNLISKEFVEIDTIEDLITSNLTIFAPEYLQNDDSFWSNLKPILRDKINFKGVDEINKDVVTGRKFNNAYIFTDSAAEYLDMLLHTYTPVGTSYKRTVRIMNEKICCRLSSYRISKNSHLKGYVNNFIRRFIENGLYDMHLEWIRRLNRDVFQVNKYKSTNSDPVVLNMNIVFGIFILYSVGVTISLIIFVCELKM